MIKVVFPVYKTDAWHSYASRDLIGIGTSEFEAFEICLQQAKKEGQDDIDKEQRWNLSNLKQTQGYAGEGEFHFEQMELNALL